MRLLVSGSNGFIGRALVRSLAGDGHEVIRLVRGDPGRAIGTARWDPAARTIAKDGLEGLDAVVHLAGENIAGARWSPEQKRRIRASRVDGTALLVQALLELERPPRVLASASAIGYYGDRGAEELDEESAPGAGFLAETCRDWEAAAERAREGGIRLVLPRIGVVLGRGGGALAKMLTPFRLGLGGRLGSGKQYLSWVSVADVVGVIRHSLATETIAGPVNCVAPHPVTNAEFTRALGRVLRRPAFLPAPAFLLRLALGEMAEALLLASTRVLPRKLLMSGYQFVHEELEGALRASV